MKCQDKIFHGPHNIAGIGGYISKYLRKNGFISDFIVYNDNTMRYNHDLNLKLYHYKKIHQLFIKIFFFVFCITKYHIFHFYFGRTFFNNNIDLPILKLFGKKIIMTYCGSDIRLIKYVESKRNPYSYLLKNGLNDPKYDDKKNRMMKWHSLWCNKIIAVRDNYEHAIFAINKNKVLKHPWIHNLGFDTKNLARDIKTNKIPILIHAPSNKEIKGSKYIEEAIENLKKKGLNFKYQRVEKTPNHLAQEMYQNADIIIDQLLIGSFGTLAVEGMGYGKPVVCYIIEEVKKDHYPDCPIYNASIENIEEKLENLILDEKLRLHLGKEGVKFVKKHFNTKTILEEMERIYETL